MRVSPQPEDLYVPRYFSHIRSRILNSTFMTTKNKYFFLPLGRLMPEKMNGGI